MPFRPIDDSAIQADYATDSHTLGRIRANQRAVWEDLGDVLVQEMDRVARTSWDWVLIWATPWYWYPGDKSVSVALLADRLPDGDGDCQIELCCVFAELGTEPTFDVGVESFELIEDLELLELTSPEYRFESARFGFIQVWMRAPNQPTTSYTSGSQTNVGYESIDTERCEIRDEDNVYGTHFSGYEPSQLVLTQNGLDGSLLVQAHVCLYQRMSYWAGSASLPTHSNAFFIDSQPIPQEYTITVWAYAGIRPHQIGLRLNRHTSRGWYTAREDQIQTGQTQTQIAFQALAEGDRALYGMRRPWALWYEQQVGGGVAAEFAGVGEGPSVRLLPMPRHADRLRHRAVFLVLGFEQAGTESDRSSVPFVLRAEMAEADEGTGLTLYGDWAGEVTSAADREVFGRSHIQHSLRVMCVTRSDWYSLLYHGKIVSVVFGRNPDDPGVALNTSPTAPYLARISLYATRFRSWARIVFGSVWSEEV